MKNKAIKITNTKSKDFGKYAVSNKKGTYLIDYVYDTEAEAIERSMVMNVTNLHWKMEAEYKKLVKAYPSKYADICDYGNEKCTLGDLLA